MKLAANLCRRALSLVVIAPLHLAMAQETALPLVSPIKNLRPAAPPSTETEMQTGERRPNQPTTPQAKYPQYQLGHQQRQNSETRDVKNGRIRFFLALPTGPVLIDAAVTIDGSPFQIPRQRRVDQLLKEISAGKQNETGDVTTAEKSSSQNSAAVSTIQKRLRHTAKLTGEAVTGEEIHWLLTNWIDGPTILQLNDNFQRFRANQRPEFVILDRNRDGSISAEEMKLAARSFQECDLNQDGLIQFTEVSVTAVDPQNAKSDFESGNLISILSDDASAGIAYERLVPSQPQGNAAAAPRFDTNRNGQLDSEELKALRESDPDLKVSIDFDTRDPEKSRVALTGIGAECKMMVDRAEVDWTGITLRLAGVPVVFTAVQMQATDQISIGAVKDGYPFLPLLDLNDDGKLTIRELNGVPATLKGFDRNQDGAITADEAPSTIRICFGLGACVHRELAGIRSIHRKENSTRVVGPEWFIRMDRNGDNDLTRGEFPGTDQQFIDLDTDGDELISAQEALEFDKKSEAARAGSERPTVNQRAPETNDSTSVEKMNIEKTKP